MKFSGIIAATVVAVSLTSPYARAQDAPHEFLSVLTVTVTPGMTGQFESFVRAINDAAGQISDTRTIQAYQVRFGGPVNRYLFDPADWTTSRWIVPGGASGHPGSPHYADQTELHADVEYIPALWDFAEIEAEAETVQRLEPSTN